MRRPIERRSPDQASFGRAYVLNKPHQVLSWRILALFTPQELVSGRIALYERQIEADCGRIAGSAARSETAGQGGGVRVAPAAVHAGAEVIGCRSVSTW